MAVATKFIVIIATTLLIALSSVVYTLHYGRKQQAVRQSLLIPDPEEHYQSIILSEECLDTKCSNRLSRSDQLAYERCSKGSRPSETDCVFLKDNNRGAISLASFPGSGNTWVRGLLQKATGYCTGAIYCDGDLRKHGFAGEGVISGSVLVTKTHRPSSSFNDSRCDYHITFTKGILILRDPFKAIISEWNRRNGKGAVLHGSHGHTAVIGETYFNHNADWNKFVKSFPKTWLKLIQYWIVTWSSSHDLHVVKYEDIVENSTREISKMLKFIGIPMKQDAKNIFEETFHRKFHVNFTHYTQDQVGVLNNIIKQAQNQLVSLNLHTKFNISFTDYLKTAPI